METFTNVETEVKVQTWLCPLADGSKAVGVFNLGSGALMSSVLWEELGVEGPQIVRDLWSHENLGVFEKSFQTDVASHGCSFVNVCPA